MLIVIVGDDGGQGNALEQALVECGLDYEIRRIADAATARALPVTDGIDVFVASAWTGTYHWMQAN